MNEKKTVLITGASSGLGEAFSHLLAAQFQQIILVARDESKLQALALELRRLYAVDVLCWPHDLTIADDLQRLIANIQQHKIDLFINNAGEGIYGEFHQIPAAQYARLIELNITALTALNHAVIPQLIANQGMGVINIASLAALQPLPFMAVYAASKSYVLHLSTALSEEYRHSGITIMALCPGFIQTPFIDKATINPRGFPLADPATVAAQGWHAFLRHKSVYITGYRNRLLALLMRLSPRRLATRVAFYLMRQRH
jgi:Short-chain dehydrogenases of various substrate specificities